MLIVYVSFDMIVDLEVHVEIVHHKCRQGSNLRPREVFFFWVRESIFLGGKRFSEIFYHETPAKDKGGVRERFGTVCFLFAKNGRVQRKFVSQGEHVGFRAMIFGVWGIFGINTNRVGLMNITMWDPQDS